MRPSETVLFVGKRRQALEAAGQLGLDVVCIAERPLQRRESGLVSSYLRVNFSDRNLDWQELARRAADGRTVGAVFALTERAVQPAARIRQCLGVAGDSVTCAVRSTDKLEMKRAIAAAGIPCAAFLDGSPGPDELIERLGLPMVLKARISSGGRRNRVYRSRDEIRALPKGWMAETFVDGVEMSFESLVSEGRPVFCNPTEYYRIRFANIAPAVLPPEVRREVESLNARVLSALGVETAFTHVELFLTPDGPVFGEIAARPPGGYITDLIEAAYGFDPWKAWLRMGLGERVELPAQPVRCAGAWILHPGEGTVRSVEGLSQARAMPGVEDVRLRLRPGDRVEERKGSGQEVGHLVVHGKDRDEVAHRLTEAHGVIRIEMERDAADSGIS